MIFNDIDLSTNLQKGITRMGFKSPTPVQEKAIMPIMKNEDVIVQAPTGSGKTCAFAIPLVSIIDTAIRGVQGLVLCPTRELAIQTTQVLRSLTMYSEGIKSLAIYGGEDISKQIVALKKKPQIIVATPGRLIDHIHRKTIKLDKIKMTVLDEADRMLDMGFKPDMDLILSLISNDHQTIMFSATMSKAIKEIALGYQTNSKTIHVKGEYETATSVKQFYSVINKNRKYSALTALLKTKSPSLSLVFTRTKRMADNLAKQLKDAKYSADALHGGLTQKQRDRIMKKYRTGKIKVLVATDVAARGIDVNNIDMVINFDIPEETESYIHRIGRTGRADASGVAYTFVYKDEVSAIESIKKETKAKISLYEFADSSINARYDTNSLKTKNSENKKSGSSSRNNYRSKKSGSSKKSANSYYAAKRKASKNTNSNKNKNRSIVYTQ